MIACFIPVRYARYPPRYFAIKLYESMKGIGTDEKTLTRVVVTRAEVKLTL
jgi:annexin A7/11